MDYMALKPVRLAKKYLIGETIAGTDITPSAAKRLLGTGRIAHIEKDAPAELPNAPIFAAVVETLPDEEANEDAGRYVCGDCGKVCKTPASLARHKSVHK